jgi:hypothetical protein
MQLPIQNATALLGALSPLAAQFGTQTGNSSSDGTSELSPAQQAWGWMSSLGNLVKAYK